MANGDKSEINVAIVALIVSLIALFVTANQLLIQLANTADGYRRCAESVIDVWHVKRKRVFKWSEFRFETQYTTPQVVLLSPQEFLDYEYEYGEVYLLNSTKLNDNVCKELDKTVHQDYCSFGKRRDRIRSQQDKPLPHVGRGGSDDVEKAEIIHKRTAARKRQQVKARIRTESDPLVSWLRLLRELHQVSFSYWPKDCTNCTTTWDEVDTGIVPTDYDALKPMEVVDELEEDFATADNSSRTDIAVIYRIWTWDFMPPDMVRPLAEVNVGDIVVLALRMGMQWRALDPEFGKMQADGNGYNLSATDVKGLGLVLRFTAAGHHDRFPRLIPSRAADKMLCGIVPGDPDLVKKDFPMVTNNAQVQDIAAIDGILAKIGMPDHRREDIRSHANDELTNDVITLLLPFLPLEGSTMASYAFPGWKTSPGICHIYCFWEGRIAIHRKLQERIHDAKIGPILKEKLSEVLNKMDFLERKYNNDWYSRWAWANCIRNTNGWNEKNEAIRDSREIFNWTTNYFKTKDFHAKSHGGHTRYVHLVAGHAYMADYALEDCNNFLQHYSKDRAQHALKHDYGITTEHGHYFVFEQYEVGCHYVKHFLDADHGVRQYLLGKGIVMTEEDVEEAWWVLQLRGIVWNFSTWLPDNINSSVYGGNLIPSAFYGNKSPVWIT